YRHGCEVAWSALYPEDAHVDLPTYPWQRKRFWATPSLAAAPNGTTSNGVVHREHAGDGHPLLQRHLQVAATGDHYWEGDLTSATMPLLMGTPLLPAATVIELALAAAGAALPGQEWDLVDVVMERNVLLVEDHHTLQTVLQAPTPDGARSFSLFEYARGDSPVAARLVARGRVEPVAALSGVIGETREVEIAASDVGFDHTLLGVAFDLVRSATGDIEDANVVARLDRVRLARSVLTAGEMLRVRTDGTGVRIESSTGDRVFEAEGIAFAPLAAEVIDAAARRQLGDWLYDVAWQPAAATQSAPPSLNGHWLILADAGGLADEVVRALETRGATCSVVTMLDEDANDLLPQVLAAAGPVVGVVNLVALDGPSGEGTQLEDLEAAQRRACGSVIHLVQALLAENATAPARIWLVTRGAEPAVANTPVAVSQSLVWGLARTVGLEHPELWGGVVDLDPASASLADDAAALLSALEAGDDEDQVAIRSGQRMVARLVRAELPSAERFRWRADATYLITGGLGSLGLLLARWMVDNGARHLVLTSRRGLPPASASNDPAAAAQIEAVDQLERLGARVTIASVDAADEQRMAALLTQLETDSAAPLRGVIHLAGVSELQPLRTLTLDAFQAVLRPKVSGAWVLHELTRHLDLDVFVLFSSAASVWGSRDAAHYVTGNHFLDSLAHHRRAIGLPAVAVNWGWWAGSAMVPPELQRYFAQLGLGVLTPEQGLHALGCVMNANVVQRTVADVDWHRFKPIYAAKRRRPFLDDIEARGPGLIAADSAESGALVRELSELPPAARWQRLTSHMQAEVCRVMGIDPSDPPPLSQGFFNLGMDSLMSVDLTSRLEVTLGQSLPSTLAFECPTIESLCRYLAANILDVPLDQPSTSDGLAVLEPAPVSDEFDHLSEEDLVDLLVAELDRDHEHV
ncbi:MAG TPA: SDR family NAD(P)-dependent oxidoreductase, partial [Chloroflexota bacterium]